jgi:hypothetical protein
MKKFTLNDAFAYVVVAAYFIAGGVVSSLLVSIA